MRALLDTQILIWAVSRPDRLSRAVATTLADRENEVLFSAVSIWEVAIKFALGRPDFTLRPEALIEYAARADFGEVKATSLAAARVADLPLVHRNPFDRLLVAKAIDVDAMLLTADKALVAYGRHVSLAA